MAGVIAAVNNNGRGVCGIAGGRSNQGGVKIMSCQIMGNSEGAKTSNKNVKAFEYAWTNGAVIAQNSWGYLLEDSDGNPIPPEQFEKEWNQGFGSMRDAIDTFIRGAAAKNPDSPLQGGLVIFAAGNDGDVYGDAAVYPAVRWIGASGPLTIPITVRGSISRLPAGMPIQPKALSTRNIIRTGW